MATIEEFSEGMAKAVKSASSSVVRVEGRRWNAASGLVLITGEDGEAIVVTAHHAVERDEDLRIGLPNGEGVLPATLAGRDPITDLAVLKVQSSDLKAASLGKPENLAVGNIVLALGRPGRSIQASLGIIQAVGADWRTPAGGWVEQYLRPDLVMYPGFSGGPLVDISGQVLGMNTSGLLRNGPVALPAATLQRVVAVLLTYGRPRRGYLGIGSQPVRLPDSLIQQLPEQLPALKGQETGLLISSVEAGSPAEKAGLLLGDTLVAIDDRPLARMDDLFVFLNGEVIGKVVTVIVARGGTFKKVDLTVGDR